MHAAQRYIASRCVTQHARKRAIIKLRASPCLRLASQLALKLYKLLRVWVLPQGHLTTQIPRRSWYVNTQLILIADSNHLPQGVGHRFPFDRPPALYERVHEDSVHVTLPVECEVLIVFFSGRRIDGP